MLISYLLEGDFMEKCIDEVKKMIRRQVLEGRSSYNGIPFSKYQKVYFSTNENIREYLNFVNFKYKKDGLSVLGSGDHIFNLINKGILNIDTFDTNLLTDFYVFGIKAAMVQKYNYKEYLSVISKLINYNTPSNEIDEILMDLLPSMDNKYRKFWKEIINFNYQMQKKENTNISLINLLFINIRDVEDIMFKNNYLFNEYEFNKLKNNIFKSNITYKNIDAIDLPKEYRLKYDVILFSNIFDYMYKRFGFLFQYNDIKDFIESLKNMLNKDGFLYLNYVFKYASEVFYRKNLIQNSTITFEDLKDSQVLKVDSNNKELNTLKDGIIILKKK